jgi:hypothetical protein
MRIDTPCEFFKAELGRNLRILGLNVDGVDEHFSTQKTCRSMAQDNVKLARERLLLTAFPLREQR